MNDEGTARSMLDINQISAESDDDDQGLNPLGLLEKMDHIKIVRMYDQNNQVMA